MGITVLPYLGIESAHPPTFSAPLKTIAGLQFHEHHGVGQVITDSEFAAEFTVLRASAKIESSSGPTNVEGR